MCKNKCDVCSPLQRSLEIHEKQIEILERSVKRNIINSITVVLIAAAFMVLFVVTGFQNYRVQAGIVDMQRQIQKQNEALIGILDGLEIVDEVIIEPAQNQIQGNNNEIGGTN